MRCVLASLVVLALSVAAPSTPAEPCCMPGLAARTAVRLDGDLDAGVGGVSLLQRAGVAASVPGAWHQAGNVADHEGDEGFVAAGGPDRGRAPPNLGSPEPPATWPAVPLLPQWEPVGSPHPPPEPRLGRLEVA
eukprot:CAMPEP_0179200798 /NCGR_PEP_ID=MMETSP0796-20121207/99933_1 /TAXON_ID=73915 /ORGANISM="Pyrodinium bahamense, Strain pbaha01" /LENGTH=133 /DNA_ID=CAMNT_0020905355 /DNA_START=104 /DNA_END=501 /DNA_ORIENTATION=+